MKKQFLLIIAYCIILNFSSFAQNVYIPDANFKQGLIGAGVDVNNDGEIQIDEAIAINTISLSSKDISDMTGLEAFINVENLYIRRNDFTSLDLSKNTKLRRINIEDNDLSNVDFSNNPLLEWINIWNCDFSEIDLSPNVNLESFAAANNNFTTLDISSNKKMTSLYCHGNKLEYLNIKNGLLAYEEQGGEINLDFRFNPNLAEICTDTDQIQVIEDLAESYGMDPIVTSMCNTNGDEMLNILILGTNSSINGAEAFSPDQIAQELQNILIEDLSISMEVNVAAEDIHMNKDVTLGLGGSGTEYTWTHHSHSLAQYYYWPEGQEARMDNLTGNGGVDWDYVVIGADPNIISSTPGYYSLGVNKVAAKVAEGGAQPLLLMMWPKDESSGASIEQFEEFTYRTADGAKVELPAIPSGLAWNALPEEKKDNASVHPSPNGAYLTAATIYSHIYNQSASSSEYVYDNELADVALSTVIDEASKVHYSGIQTFMSPFKSCDISDDVLNYNHTGTSSENGIKAGLDWIFNQAPETLQNGGTSPINFNYGRANSNFEPNKRYKIDPALFDFSFGFPMQDHGNHGDVSMLYGLDRRESGTMNDTDLGVARFMIEESELPYARAIPIRTLFAQMREVTPSQSAYRDSWHMHRDLDKAIAAYMFTLMTGNCAMGEEPPDQSSDQWRTWMAHKIGYETAWNLMYLEGAPPNCNMLVDMDGDGFNSFVDCDDNNVNISPGLMEEPYNGLDDDCNPATPDDDLDQDGFLLADDCDDNNSEVNTDQTEEPYNGIDDDCDPETLDDDLDQDGFVLADDCNDNNSEVNTDQTEEPYNGLDDDCDPATLDDDLDQDGFALVDDCDDNNSEVNTDQTEEPYNGIDDDCDPTTLDDDLDQDGFLLADDCDDNNSEVNTDQTEEPYNGIDDDCDSATLDDDLDQDGFLLADDCDDNNSNINTEADEIPNNGIDEDCDGMDLILSIHELGNSTINIYPNPTIDIINMDVSENLEYSAKLYDLGGRLIISTINQTKIQIQALPQGTYLLEIKNLKSGKKVVERVVKGE